MNSLHNLPRINPNLIIFTLTFILEVKINKLNRWNNSGILQSLSMITDLDLKHFISIFTVFYFIFIYFKVGKENKEIVEQFVGEIKNELN